MKNILSFMVSTVVTANALAALNLSHPRGERSVSFQSPQGKKETCIIPQKIDPTKFSKGDLQEEEKICKINFYSDSLVCPKQNSTNPGLLIGKPIEGLSKSQAESRLCQGPANNFKVSAKFKQSITCTYTPSILAYYQFSRILEAGRVPVAVIRTMDVDYHYKEVQKALSLKLEPIMQSTWSLLAKAHNVGNNSALFDTTGEFVYGALVENIKKELRYTEVSGRGDYETRYERFLQQAPFIRVTNPHGITSIVGSEQFSDIAQTLVQMKDVSDMILLDTLFSQDDRIGNIHYKFAWYYPEEGKVQRKSSDAEVIEGKVEIPPDEQARYSRLGGVFIKEMVLKDNDCGVDITKRTNMMRKISAIEQVRHMSAKTYSRFLALAKMAKTPEFESYMQRELLFTKEDLKGAGRSFQNNLDRAVKVLTENCRNGSLKLDLNLNDYVPGAKKIKISCEG